MSRLSPFDPAKLDPATQTLFNQLLQDYGPYANMLSAFAPRPPSFRTWCSRAKTA